MPFNRELTLKYLKTGHNYISSKFLTDLSILTGKTLSKPKQVYYILTDKCNARCIMCVQWEKGRDENKEEWISTSKMKEILINLANWKVPKFGISGGEPLIFENRMFEVLSIANSLGMYSHFGTNGWLLNKDVFIRYKKMGGGHISLSLDGMEKIHDQIRGKKGLFARCMSAIETFKSLELKNIHMKINTIIARQNINEINDLIKISRESKIPFYFQPVDTYDSDSFLKLNQDEMAKKYLFWIPSNDNNLLDDKIQLIKMFKQQFPHLVLNSEKHLNLIPYYFRNSMPLNLTRKCLAAFETMFIRPNGDVKVCLDENRFSLKELGIKEIYYSKQYDNARKKALTCKYPCMQGCLNRQRLWELIKIGIRNIITKNHYEAT